MGEGEPGADGGPGHPGRPAGVQRSRRGDTTGEHELHLSDGLKLRFSHTEEFISRFMKFIQSFLDV